MGKYIDAEKLIASLNKTMQSYKSQMVDPRKYPIDHIDLMAFLAREYQAIIANVTSLQQPEVDLDFQVFAKEMDAVFNLPKEATENTEENPLNWEYAIARHFAEWGVTHLNARKEEEK